MQRLFVAIKLPAAIRAGLIMVMGGVSAARWQTDDQLHLTLRFIGEVDRHGARDVDAALSGLVHPRFEIAISGIGVFERRGRPDTIWAGIAPQEPVKVLHNKVDQALAMVGIAPDQRAFLPHVTLARLNRGSGAIGNFVEGQSGLSSPPFTVDTFSLFESRLTPAGADYRELSCYPLR